MNTALWVVPLALVMAGCATPSGAIPRPFPAPGEPSTETRAAAVRPGTAAADGYAVAGTALSFRGAPYRAGGADPAGFDCSGLVHYVFAQHGLNLPQSVPDLFQKGRGVESDQLAAGDLLFFTTTAPGATHVAIAIGGDEFVHAPKSEGTVRVERLSANYWSHRYLGARRMF